MDFITFGAFENHMSDDQKAKLGEYNKTSNATPGEPPMSVEIMTAEVHPTKINGKYKTNDQNHN